MESTTFQDALLELLEKSGGTGRDNLVRLAGMLRDIKPDFTYQYLIRLMSGHPPSDPDRVAISNVLDSPSTRWMSEFWKAEDSCNRRLAAIARSYTRSPKIAKELVDGLSAEVSFRDKVFSIFETKQLMSELLAQKMWEDELYLFHGIG